MEWAYSNKWAHIVLSDESMFRTFVQYPINRIRRFDYERFSPISTKKVIAHGTQVHAWGCFSRFGVGILKRIRWHINSTIYQDSLVNDIDEIGKCLVFPLKSFVFKHDNVPCHKPTPTVSFLFLFGLQILLMPILLRTYGIS